jgi:hypothetical protein
MSITCMSSLRNSAFQSVSHEAHPAAGRRRATGRPAPPSGARLRPRDDPSSWENALEAPPRDPTDEDQIQQSERHEIDPAHRRHRPPSEQESPGHDRWPSFRHQQGLFTEKPGTGADLTATLDGKRTWRLIYIVYARRGIMRLFLFSLVLHF